MEKNEFCEEILNHIENSKWVNIEEIYYQNLQKLLRRIVPHLNNRIRNFEKIKPILNEMSLLNNQLDYLKNQLVNYLIDQDKRLELSEEIYFSFINIFTKLNLYDTQIKIMKNAGIKPTQIENTYFLNFNYTTTISKYLDFLNLNRFKEIQIHGNIQNPLSIIFGYGDEMHKSYQEIEDLNQNEFFTHMKSFGYFQNNNYQELTSFVEGSDSFEVYVLGHSLGLSDRTMLSEIFNAENLTKIHLFYYQKEDGTDDYTEKTFEISRHFKDKANMRKKIVPKKLSQSMPQIKI